MELFQKILKAAVDGGASDIHLKIGTPVIYRISREDTLGSGFDQLDR